MSFAVKLDENLSLAHVNLPRQAGYDADRVDEQGLSGATDERVWEPFVPIIVCSSPSILIFPIYAGTNRVLIPASF